MVNFFIFEQVRAHMFAHKEMVLRIAIQYLQFYWVLSIYLHTVKSFQVLLLNYSSYIYQIFLSHTNNFYIAAWFQVTNDNPY